MVVDGSGGARRRADVAVDGHAVTPWWIDIHTHLDAQALWDDAMIQTSVHGVTSVVMSNCGVGIAPVHPTDRAWILDLLDGVEDIPADALAGALAFDWETFPESLDVVDRGRYAFDVAAHVPHSAVRRYVMGER